MKKFLLPIATAILPTFCYSLTPSDIVISAHIGYPFTVGSNAYHYLDTSADFRFAYDLQGRIAICKNFSAGIVYRASYLHHTFNVTEPQGAHGILETRNFFHQFDPYAEYRIQLSKKMFIAPQLGFGFSYEHSVIEPNNISSRQSLHISGFNLFSGITLGYSLSSKFDVELQGNYSFNKMQHKDAENIPFNKQAQIIIASVGASYHL